MCRKSICCGLRVKMSFPPANWVPMANILFPASAVGIIVLTLMIFHQVQLMVCSFIAQRYITGNEKKLAKQQIEAQKS